MQLNLTVQNANSIVCQVVPTPTQTINIDRGVTGNGIASIVPVTIATFQYLQITYTNGTVVDVGPLTSTAYTATSPIVITGNTISLSTVQPQQGGTGAAGTLTGYVYGNATGAMTASTTIPNTAITGLGTMSTQNANNVAITGGTIQGVALTIDSIQSTPIGSTTPSTGAFTALSASSTVSGTGFSTYLASPPAIGGTAANTAKFTTLAVTGLTGYTYANGSGNLTASTTIPNAGLANSSLTVNGVSIALGASGTVTAAAGTLTGTTLNSTVTGSSLTSVGTITTGVWNATPITNSFLANSSITVNGTSISLGGSGTITAATTSTLTIGSGLSGGSFNGSAPVTIANTGVLTFSGGTTGLTPNTATNGAITLAGTLAVANGGTGVTSSSGANSVVLRDANGNVTTNCLFEGYTSQAAGTTITLTASSVQNWAITGSGGQTIQLPNATTLPAGATFTFNNNQSSGTIVVQNNSATTIATVQSGSYITVVLLSNSSAAGSWDFHNSPPSNASWSTNTLNWAGSYTNGTWNGNAVGAIYGGTGQTAVTTGDLLYGSASNTWSRLGVGSTGQILRVAGGVPTWGVDYTGTVTSVAATVPSFLSISGSPITTSGTLAIGYSGTALPTANGGTGLTSFTANQVFYASSTSAFAQSSNLQFDGSKLTLANDASISTLTVGLGTTSGGSTNAISTVLGYQALSSNTSGQYNIAVGYQSLKANTTGQGNVGVAVQALLNNTSGNYNTVVGSGVPGVSGSALSSNTTGSYNSAFGNTALLNNTTGQYNTALGAGSLASNTTASNNTAVGYQAGYSNTTGSSNTAVGYQAGFSSTGSGNTALGQGVSVGTSGNNNTCLGIGSGISLTSGSGNVFVGSVGSGSTGGAGYFVTTGSNNTILGGYTGNNGGLDIRTASNYIVLSDGAGNPRANWTSTGNMVSGAATPIISGNNSFQLGHASNYIFEMGNTANTGLEGCLTTLLTSANNATTSYHYASYCSSSSSLAYSTMVFGVLGNGNVKNANNSYGAISDIKVKQNISLSGSQWNDVKALGALVKKFSLISDPTNTMQIGWVAQDVQTVSPGLVYSTPDRDENHELTGTSTLGVNYSIAYMKAFKALSEAQVRIETLESTIAQMQAALKAAGIAGF